MKEKKHEHKIINEQRHKSEKPKTKKGKLNKIVREN